MVLGLGRAVIQNTNVASNSFKGWGKSSFVVVAVEVEKVPISVRISKITNIEDISYPNFTDDGENAPQVVHLTSYILASPHVLDHVVQCIKHAACHVILGKTTDFEKLQFNALVR